jgi:hypothetical protein
MGTVVTIHGTHFTGTTQILFGGTPAASFTVLSDTLLSTVIGSGSTGAVKVFTHGGLAVAAATFGFIPTPPTAPHILFFRPDSARQGDTVTIYGPHLDSVIAVSFGGVPAQSFVIAADSLIKAIVGTGASGYVTVASADASDSLGGFIFIPADTTIPPPPPSAFTLISFSGMAASHHAVLNWDVLHDQSVFFYSVEHSVDTISAHFGGIGGDVALHLDSAHYTFTDTALRSGVQYYRLRIIDTVGATTLSYPIAVSLGDSVGSLSLYPNPASWQITVQVPSRLSSSRFVLADASGHIVLTVPVRAGVQQVTLPVGRFNRGVYKLVWSNGRATATQTVLLMK